MCGFIAQLVEHRTGIAEVTGSNPVEALIFFFFFRLLLSNCVNWKFTAMITLHSHLQPQYKYELFHIYFSVSGIVSQYTLMFVTQSTNQSERQVDDTNQADRYSQTDSLSVCLVEQRINSEV